MPEDNDSIKLWDASAPHTREGSNPVQPYLEPFVLSTSGTQAAVIICPGGGYAGRAAHEGEPIARWLNGLGITAFVLHYRVFPDQHPVPLLDVQRAVRTVRARAEEFRINPDQIGVLGFSAGGHLAATAGTHFDTGIPHAVDLVDTYSCRPDFLILCYPVISFVNFSHQGSVKNLIGSQPPEELMQQLSAERCVTKDTPPTFLWHTADDEAVPVDNSLLFAQALRGARVPVELHVYESGQHGLGLATGHPYASGWTQACAHWLRGRGMGRYV